MNTITKLKAYIDKVSLQLFESEDKSPLKQLFLEMANNQALATLYTVINNLQTSKIDRVYVDDFINENKKACKNINLLEFRELSNKLPDVDSLDTILHDIEIVLFEDRNISNFITYTKAYNNVVNNLIAEDVITPTIEINESNIPILEQLVVDPKGYADNIINECITIVNEKIKECEDLDTKLLLYETKDQLLVMKENELEMDGEKLYENVVEVLKLKENLL